ncbi:MAG: HipA domain-containing protein [Synergistaceae bacterium]|jgi:hypothetical protein|nr:HipA domain-containing protein [Synergistaceae bacterium]
MALKFIYYDKTKVAVLEDDGNVSFDSEGIKHCGMPPLWVPRIRELLENSLPEGLRRDALVRLAVKNGAKPGMALELVPYLSELPGRFSVGGDDAFADGQKTAFRAFSPLPAAHPRGARVESRLPVSFFDPLSERRIDTKPSFSGYQDKFTANLKLDSDGFLALTETDQETERGNVIVKPAHPKYPFIGENEYLCMELARNAGLPVPRVFLFRQPGIALEPRHIAVERFDVRVLDGTPVVLDISELASLMGLSSRNKYDTTTEQFFGLAKSIFSPEDMRTFAKAYLFGCIVRNGDMHAKNFSAAYREGKYFLSPVYDMVNTEVYGDDSLLALPLEGEYSPKPANVVKFFLAHLTAEDIESTALSVRKNLEECAETTFSATSRPNVSKFRKTLEQSISGGASRILRAVRFDLV